MEMESNLMNAYSEAHRIACIKLSEADRELVCQNSRAIYQREINSYCLKYYDKEYIIDCITGAVTLKQGSSEVSITEKVLILHYLIHARPKPLTGTNISFMEVTGGGNIYYSTFKKRAIDPLVKVFSNDMPAFKRAAENLFGDREKFGTMSYTIKAFPQVPITYVLWLGDDEVASSGTILLDASVTSFLPVEDIVLAASFGAYKLIGLKGL